MPFKMKGFPMMKGTGAMKAMKESAMKKMHASPKKAMKDPMKAMKNPMKKNTDDDKFMTKKELDNFYKNQSTKAETKTYTKDHPRSKEFAKIEKLAKDGKITEAQKKQRLEAVQDKYKGGGKTTFKAMKDPMKAMHASPKKAMHASPKKAMSPKKKMTDSKVALNAMALPGGATKKALGKMADDKGKKVAKQTPQLGRLKSKLTIKANGKKEASEKDKLKKFLKKNSPKKAMSPKKKTIAKDKDPKFKKSNRRSQAEFEPMYEGADISRAQFNKMSKREQRKYVKTQTD
jgi:hypothetical protein|tara:strand:- start:170 stop:1036 length:867 start_codon:yes stop_codon:yes gene_type:complete